jgi:hypothetical protein
MRTGPPRSLPNASATRVDEAPATPPATANAAARTAVTATTVSALRGEWIPDPSRKLLLTAGSW